MKFQGWQTAVQPTHCQEAILQRKKNWEAWCLIDRKARVSQILCERFQRLDNSRANNIRIGVVVSTESFSIRFRKNDNFHHLSKVFRNLHLIEDGGRSRKLIRFAAKIDERSNHSAFTCTTGRIQRILVHGTCDF